MSVNDWFVLLYWTVGVYIILFLCTTVSVKMVMSYEDKKDYSGWGTALTGFVLYALWWICSKFLSLLLIAVVAVLAVGNTNYG